MGEFLLAIAHHVVILAMAAILVVELMVVRPQINATQVTRLRRLDGIYGSFIALILFIGILRVSNGAKGQDFYTDNPLFWMKMVAFAAVGLLSVQPSIRIYSWSQQTQSGGFFSAPPDEVARVRLFLWIEAGVFLTIPFFAVAAARGFGL